MKHTISTPSYKRLLSIKESSMSSPDSTKKRRIAVGSSGGADDGIVDDEMKMAMSIILAKLNDIWKIDVPLCKVN